MSDPREALVALIWSAGEVGDELTFECDCGNCVKVAGRIADVIQAGWTPPGERVKPTVEDVARAILMVTQAADVDPDYAWNVQCPEVQDELLDQARAVLALLPGRTETEVKAEGWDEGAQAGLDAGLSVAENVHANGGTLDLASIPNAPVNPYRKESDHD